MIRTNNGAKIIFNAKVNKILIDETDENKVCALEYQDGEENQIKIVWLVLT
jgi:hypothetical protein